MMEASGSKNHRKRSRKSSTKKNDDDESNNFFLPNNIIDKIFTFLPIKDAVSSSVVAKAFENSWLYVRNLCFNRSFVMSCFLHNRDVISIINHILSNHVGEKIYSFQLYIHDPERYTTFFLQWIQHVLSKGLEEFELHLVEPSNGFSYYLCSETIDIDTLCVLKLINCYLYFSPKIKSLPFLKSLSLTRVRVAPHFIQNVFSTCVALESLALEYCTCAGEITITGSNMFRSLLIVGCIGIIWIIIANPNISTFHYGGEINKIKFVDSIRLKDVILDFTAPTGYQHIRGRDDLMEVLSNVQTLSINSILLEGLTPRYMNYEFREMEYHLLNLKEVQLVRRKSSFINSWDILSFVKNCPHIERLFLDFGDHPMEAGSYWNMVSKEKFEECETEFPQLKLLKVKGFKRFGLEEKLVNYLLLHANSLESLIIVTSRNNHHEIRSSDFLTVSNGVTISTHSRYTDASGIFPRHRILSV